MSEKTSENHITAIDLPSDSGVIKVAYFHQNGEKPVEMTLLQILSIQRHARENKSRIQVGTTNREFISSLLNRLGLPELVSAHMTSKIPDYLEISEPFGAFISGQSLTVVVAEQQILFSRNST